MQWCIINFFPFSALSELQQHVHRGRHNLPLSYRRVHRVSGEHHQVSQEPQRLPRLRFQVTACCMHGFPPFLSFFFHHLCLFWSNSFTLFLSLLCECLPTETFHDCRSLFGSSAWLSASLQFFLDKNTFILLLCVLFFFFF